MYQPTGDPRADPASAAMTDDRMGFAPAHRFDPIAASHVHPCRHKSGLNNAATGPIVHVGYHKTGTTWFQESFYPAVRNRTYRSRLAARAALLDVGALHFDPAAARAALGDDLERMVLCEENLSGGLHNGGLAGNLSKDVACRIRAALPGAQIVIFVRDPCSAIASAYLQYLKGGGTYSVRRYLFGRKRLSPAAPERDEAPGFRLEHFDYARLIAHYDALFGEERVHVFRYEDFRADRRGFVAAYAARFGLEVDLDRLDWSVRNPSPSRLLVALLRAANMFTRRAVADKSWLMHVPGWYKLSRQLLRRANACGRFGRPLGTHDILDEATHARLAEYYRPCSRALDARIARQAATASAVPQPLRRSSGPRSFALLPLARESLERGL
ncbi:sulfotransferase [Novosphingobium sp. CF614]|uniref:sulfotransferase n=1 Tax=Novosphingobium sp. CF614 TaxID=1884364 RepID=UPI0021019D80|nr:sulfotransferase [Novosphingobium sp. CF614]